MNLKLAPLQYSVQSTPMGEGRLVRVRKYRGDPDGTAYVVAEPDKSKAIGLIANNVASEGQDIEDLGRVSANLVAALSLEPGEFVVINGVRHVSQQQQQVQSSTLVARDE